MNREEIVKGIKGCVGAYYGFRCGECPYGPYSSDCVKRLHRDVERLIEAQTPRVMTLDELSEKTDVFFESLVYKTIDPALSNGSYDDGTVGLMTLEDELFYMDEADYGINWRCWTSRPTDEQRQAVKWHA